jgi:hypothetical protein
VQLPTQVHPPGPQPPPALTSCRLRHRHGGPSTGSTCHGYECGPRCSRGRPRCLLPAHAGRGHVDGREGGAFCRVQGKACGPWAGGKTGGGASVGYEGHLHELVGCYDAPDAFRARQGPAFACVNEVLCVWRGAQGGCVQGTHLSESARGQGGDREAPTPPAHAHPCSQTPSHPAPLAALSPLPSPALPCPALPCPALPCPALPSSPFLALLVDPNPPPVSASTRRWQWGR